MKNHTKRFIYWAASLMLFFCFNGCKPKKQYDLTGEQVVIIAPISVSLMGYTQTLSWVKLNDAVSYHSMIYSGVHQDSLVLDTVIINNTQSFKYTFKPGNYTWKIKASNGMSSTGFSSTTFSIQTSPLTEDAPALLLPVNLGYSNDTSTLFTWRAMYQPIDWYEIQINTTESFNGTMIEDTTSNTSYTFHPSSEIIYYWRVRGITNPDTSQWSTARSFTYDITPPAQPVLTTPVDSTAGLATTGTMSWNVVSDAVTYNVYITYGTATEKKISATANTYNFSGTAGQTVKWKVEAVDAAGNISPVSDTWVFSIQ